MFYRSNSEISDAVYLASKKTSTVKVLFYSGRLRRHIRPCCVNSTSRLQFWRSWR